MSNDLAKKLISFSIILLFMLVIGFFFKKSLIASAAPRPAENCEALGKIGKGWHIWRCDFKDMKCIAGTRGFELQMECVNGVR